MIRVLLLLLRAYVHMCMHMYTHVCAVSVRSALRT